MPANKPLVAVAAVILGELALVVVLMDVGAGVALVALLVGGLLGKQRRLAGVDGLVLAGLGILGQAGRDPGFVQGSPDVAATPMHYHSGVAAGFAPALGLTVIVLAAGSARAPGLRGWAVLVGALPALAITRPGLATGCPSGAYSVGDGRTSFASRVTTWRPRSRTSGPGVGVSSATEPAPPGAVDLRLFDAELGDFGEMNYRPRPTGRTA